MPQPHEEIKSLRIELQSNDRQKLYTTEVRERFLEGIKGSNKEKEAEYRKFAAKGEFVPWRDELMKSFETIRVRSGIEEQLKGYLTSTDRLKLDLRDSRDFFAEDRVEKRVYDSLVDCFSENVLYGHSIENVYKFEVIDMAEFAQLLGEAKANAQRNATELSVNLATAMALAGQEVRTATGDLEAWQNHELYEPLAELKGALKEWNDLLGKDAMPDKTKLKDAAKKCADKLQECFRVHGPLVSGKGGMPMVKYQLLATMRAIGEKVASQYAARAGKASLTAMHELIRDVPNRGSADEATKKAK
jgi:hypothetical protein